MNRNLWCQTVTLLAIAATIVVNALANALPIAGRTTGEISNSFEVLFVPAGYVFAIWGLIYVGLVAFALYQVLPSQRENERLTRVRRLVTLSCVANIVWILLWHNLQFEWTLVAMLVLLSSLIAVYLRLDVGRVEVRGVERWAVDAVFSLYLGWITVATIANVTAVLAHRGHADLGLDGEHWAVLLLVAGVVLSVLMAARRNDWIFPFVLAWAFAGVAAAQSASPLEGAVIVEGPAQLAAVLCALCGLAVLVNKLRPEYD